MIDNRYLTMLVAFNCTEKPYHHLMVKFLGMTDRVNLMLKHLSEGIDSLGYHELTEAINALISVMVWPINDLTDKMCVSIQKGDIDKTIFSYIGLATVLFDNISNSYDEIIKLIQAYGEEESGK